jgi:hypothetical protein
LTIKYKKNSNFNINPGFDCNAIHVEKASLSTNLQLSKLPFFLFEMIDYKTTSAIIGRIFCENLAKETKSQVNPIEKGHPDIIPKIVKGISEKVLKKYPQGIEVKVTVGNVEKDSGLKPGQSRIDHLTGISWQAHHREVDQLMGIVWDFCELSQNYPIISGVFYANNLTQNDWGAISGTTGRNTKVSAMVISGKEKMGKGNIIILNDEKYSKFFQKILKFTLS